MKPEATLQMPVKESFLQRYGKRVIFGEPLAQYTYFRIGGSADICSVLRASALFQ